MTKNQNKTQTWEEATETFLSTMGDADMDTHAPAVVALRMLARALDDKMNAALVAQYGLTYRNLVKAIAGDDETDPLEAMLNG